MTRRSAAPSPARRSTEPFALGHSFRDPALLERALTHSSLPHEQPSLAVSEDGRPVDNEQLEFLGDAILGLAVAEALFASFPAAREGDLTRLRASIVSREYLSSVAVRLGRGEERSGGRQKPALLADALEAVIAALYLDGGLSPAAAFIRREIVDPALPELTRALDRHAAIGDYKTALQELLQARGTAQPRYVLTAESGPDHQRRFRVAVEIEDQNGHTVSLAEAEGTTKKRAQQDAARLALEQLATASAPPTSSGPNSSADPAKPVHPAAAP